MRLGNQLKIAEDESDELSLYGKTAGDLKPYPRMQA
jgi:hypothetical protein